MMDIVKHLSPRVEKVDNNVLNVQNIMEQLLTTIFLSEKKTFWILPV